MSGPIDRRRFIEAVGAAAVAGAAGQVAAGEAPAAPPRPAGKPVKILAVSCSPRKDKTTAAGLRVCLEEAAKVPGVAETELIELAGMDIPIFVPGGKEGDFPKIAPKLTDPKVGGILIGSPVYFGEVSSLCKAFLDHWMAFRKGFLLSGKVGGALAVGNGRNGGQELVIQSIQAILMAQEMVIVGDGKPTAHRGATLWNNKDSIAADETGLATARNLGRRVAEIAVRLA